MGQMLWASWFIIYSNYFFLFSCIEEAGKLKMRFSGLCCTENFGCIF